MGWCIPVSFRPLLIRRWCCGIPYYLFVPALLCNVLGFHNFAVSFPLVFFFPHLHVCIVHTRCVETAVRCLASVEFMDQSSHRKSAIEINEPRPPLRLFVCFLDGGGMHVLLPKTLSS